MKKGYLSAVVLAGGLLVSASTVAQAGLTSFLFGSPKPKATWQKCSVSGCQTAGSVTVESEYAKTRYPIVLAHGMAGFSSIGPIGYWNGISENLTQNGAQVFVAQQASFNATEVRSEQLLHQVKQILAISGASKVNLVGHSHGVLSVRYVAGVLPGNVASVTGVAGPNKGSEVFDRIEQVIEAPVVGQMLAPVISETVNAVFNFLGVASGHYYDNDSVSAVKSLTTASVAKFNEKFPAGVPGTACGSGTELVNGVRYYSWSGTSVFTNLLDPSDYLLAIPASLIPGPSDGFIPQCSSHLGTVIRDNYAFNHLDEINQVLGVVGLLQDPVATFRIQANRLKSAGL